jgi:ribosomal protein L37AE/L43A
MAPIDDLSGHPIIPDGPAMTPTERKKLTRRGRETARGYASPPGTGPEGETCKTCAHSHAVRLAKTYWKCRRIEHRWTGGRATDILIGSPACRGWEPRGA